MTSKSTVSKNKNSSKILTTTIPNTIMGDSSQKRTVQVFEPLVVTEDFEKERTDPKTLNKSSQHEYKKEESTDVSEEDSESSTASAESESDEEGDEEEEEEDVDEEDDNEEEEEEQDEEESSVSYQSASSEDSVSGSKFNANGSCGIQNVRTNTKLKQAVPLITTASSSIPKSKSLTEAEKGKSKINEAPHLVSINTQLSEQDFVQGKLSLIAHKVAPQLCTIKTGSNNISKKLGTETTTTTTTSGTCITISKDSEGINSTLQKMPSINDFKALSGCLNESQKTEDLTEKTRNNKQVQTEMDRMYSNKSSDTGDGGRGAISNNHNKPIIKPKPKSLERPSKNFSGDNNNDIKTEMTTESGLNVRNRNSNNNSSLSSFVSLPPISPQTQQHHHHQPATVKDSEFSRDFSPARYSKPKYSEESFIPYTSSSSSTTTKTTTTGCPAWTCCEISQQTRSSRPVRSVLSPLRQMTLSPTPPFSSSNVSTDDHISNRSSSVGRCKSPSGRKKQSSNKGGKRNYASSLPDASINNNNNNSASPFFGLDLSIHECDHDNSSGKLGKHSAHSFRGHPRPTKNCKNKHLWARASLERDIITAPPSSSPTHNRHSSYHPNIDVNTISGTNDSTVALAEAAANAAYNHVLQSSRPSSPLGVYGRSRSVCNDCDFGCCGGGGCATKTFPRSTTRLSSMSCHCCRHHCENLGTGSLAGSLLGLDYEDRLLRLESDKDTLHLQVSVLSDQIDAQTSKIQDLEKMLDDKRNTLETTEEQLSRELLTRSSLETQKLELMSEISGLRFKHASLERENLELKGRVGGGRSMTDLNYPTSDSRMWDKPPFGNTRGTSPATELGQRLRLTSTGSENMSTLTQQQQQQRVQTPPANAYRRVDQTSSFGTLPRRNQPSMLSTFNSATGVNNPVDNSTKCNSLSSGNIHAISANFNQPGAADNWQRPGNNNNNNNNSTKATSNGNHKPRRILRILGKLKRSNSGGLDNEIAPENHGDAPATNPFTRGGLRSTAMPRLGWMKEQTPLKMLIFNAPDGPISSWDSEGVVNWLIFLGLGMYANEIKRWVKSGQQLLDASTQELEKELNIKNNLHRKKLNLALHSLKNPEEDDNAGKLDYHWVTRWLDDVGMSQYKESFSDARIDGRVLSHLTAEDLISLKVTSVLHHASIKRGIQILRIHRFHPSCLCRRGSVTENLNKETKEVGTWTNHRVMEWLKAVDLAEYAPNLRGSGVHGALIVFEPRFNAELLATLLSIPSNKTLLRRHLSLQFNELIGKTLVQEKRVVETAPDFVPINPTVKVKPTKKTPTFPLRKKRLSSDFSEELLCPADWNSYPSTWDSQNQLNFTESEHGKVSNL